MNNELTIEEFKPVFNYMLDRNKALTNEGQTPIAIGIEGEAGIGKTSLVEQIAQERGMTMCKLNLSQLEEVGDLCGLPCKEVYVKWKKEDGTVVGKWYPEKLVDKLPSRITVTSKTRMAYSKPAWLPSEENPNGTILCLDDYTRKLNKYCKLFA